FARHAKVQRTEIQAPILYYFGALHLSSFSQLFYTKYFAALPHTDNSLLTPKSASGLPPLKKRGGEHRRLRRELSRTMRRGE
ncbi:MAG: hypothetical protein Q8J76_14525, partial [Desulfobulbaceae bacterium]|nr:hypothetical protein [Desulfobulbaceae bacterium]